MARQPNNLDSLVNKIEKTAQKIQNVQATLHHDVRMASVLGMDEYRDPATGILDDKEFKKNPEKFEQTVTGSLLGKLASYLPLNEEKLKTMEEPWKVLLLRGFYGMTPQEAASVAKEAGVRFGPEILFDRFKKEIEERDGVISQSYMGPVMNEASKIKAGAVLDYLDSKSALPMGARSNINESVLEKNPYLKVALLQQYAREETIGTSILKQLGVYNK